MSKELKDNFVNKTCFMKLKDREEVEFHGTLMGFEESGIVTSYESHGKAYNVFVPYQNISYVERKLVESEE